MAVVKKFESGGQMSNTLPDYLIEKIKETKFTAKTAKEAENVGDKWIKLASSGKLSEAYSYDPNTNKYTINIEKLPDDIKNSIWEGSDNGVRQNIFGQVATPKEGGENQLNSLFAGWVNEFSKSNPNTQTKQKDKYSLGDISEYIKQKYYGGAEDYMDLWGKDREILGSEEAIKKYMMNKAKEQLLLYQKNASEKPDEYNKLENPDKIINAINSGDWNTFILESRKFGWRPDEFIEGYSNKKEEEAKLNSAVSEENKRAELIKELASKGYSDNIINDVINRGYFNKPEGNVLKGFEKYPFLQETINKNALVLSDDFGRQVVIDKFGYYNPVFKDPDAPDNSYGTYLEHREGIPIFYTPNTEGYKKGLFTFPDNFSRRNIVGSVKGFEGWSLSNIPMGKGTTQDLGILVVTNPENGQEIELVKTDSGYKRLDTNELVDVDIKQYGEDTGLYEPFANVLNLQKEGLDIFSKVDLNKPQEDFSSILTKSKKINQINYNSGFIEQVSDVLPKLKYIIQNDPSVLKRNEAAVEYERLSDMVGNAEDSETILNKILRTYTKQTTQPTLTPEQIGEFRVNPRAAAYMSKFKKGGTLTKEQFYSRPGKETPKAEEEKPTDIRGTLADMSDMQTISLVGAGLSFVPGVGAIGAAVSTGADLIDDLEDGKIDNWGTHLANAGFIALSAIGLGGLKTAQSASKLAKLGEKVLPVLNKFDDVKIVKTLESAANKIKTVDGVTSFKNAGIVAEELQALKSVGLVSKKANVGTTIKRGLSKEVIPYLEAKSSKFIPTPERASLLKREFSGTINTFNKIAPFMTTYGGKALKTGMYGAGIIGLGSSALSAVSGYSQHGLEGVKYNDFKNILYGAGAARGILKTKQAIKSAKSLLKEAEGSKSKIQFGESAPIEINKELSIPKLDKIKRYKMFSEKEATKVDAKNSEIINNFKEELKSAIGEGNIPQDIDNILKSGKIKLISPEKGAIKGLGESGMAKEDYERAKAILEGKIKNYFLPGWVSNKYLKKGGIIKLQRGLNFPLMPLRVGDNKYLRNSENRGFRLGGDFLYENKLKPLTDKNLILKKNIPTGEPTTIKTPINFMEPIKNIPLEDIGNAAIYAMTRLANEKIESQQKKAAMAGVVKIPLLSRQYLRTTSPYGQFYESQAGRLTSTGKRIAESTSDLDKSILARLSTANQANELREKGVQMDQQAVQNTINQQAELDRQTNLTNLDIIGRNAQSIANAEKAVHLVDVNKLLANNTATSNLVLNQFRNKEIRDVKNRAKQLYELSTSPENIQLSKNWNSLLKEEEGARKNWEKSQISSTGAQQGKWEDSSIFKDFTKKKEVFQGIIENNLLNINNAKLALNLGLSPGSFSKGGSLEEKKYLKDLAHYYKKKDQFDKEYLKTIIENNKLMERSLIKVFK